MMEFYGVYEPIVHNFDGFEKKCIALKIYHYYPFDI